MNTVRVKSARILSPTFEPRVVFVILLLISFMIKGNALGLEYDSQSFSTDTTPRNDTPDVVYINKDDATCGGNTPCYTTMQDGINAAASGSTVKVAQGVYNEDVTVDSSKTLILQGGWDPDFTFQTTRTIVNSLTITGAVDISNIILGDTEMEVYLAGITDPDNPYAVVSTDGQVTESIGVTAEKDRNGNITETTGVTFASLLNVEDKWGYFKIGSDGYFSTCQGPDGYEIRYTNYTDTSVDMTVYDPNGNLIAGPTTANIPESVFQSLQQLSSYTNSRGPTDVTRGNAFNLTSEEWKRQLRYALEVVNAFSCVAGIILTHTGALTPVGLFLSAYGCGSTFATLVGSITGNEELQDAGDIVDANLCDTTPGVGCISPVTSAAAHGFDESDPSVPTELTATAVSSSQINLGWNPSTDDVRVRGYKVYRNGSYLTAVTTTSTSDSGLNSSTQYCYTVLAYDAAGNESEQSNQACAITSPETTTTTTTTSSSSTTTTSTSTTTSSTTTSTITSTTIGGTWISDESQTGLTPFTFVFDNAGNVLSLTGGNKCPTHSVSGRFTVETNGSISGNYHVEFTSCRTGNYVISNVNCSGSITSPTSMTVDFIENWQSTGDSGTYSDTWFYTKSFNKQ